jgi:hypothetical protein
MAMHPKTENIVAEVAVQSLGNGLVLIWVIDCDLITCFVDNRVVVLLQISKYSGQNSLV